MDIYPHFVTTDLQDRAAIGALLHEDLEDGHPGYGEDGAQCQQQTDGVCPAREHIAAILGGVKVDAGEDENDLESDTTTGEIRHRAW